MKNVSHKKGWGVDTNLAHIELPPIPLVKEMSNSKSDGDYVKLNLRRYPKPSMSNLYEFRMSLFDHGKPEKFILFVTNFQTTLAATGTLQTEAKVQYFCTLVRGEELRQFDLFSDEVRI